MPIDQMGSRLQRMKRSVLTFANIAQRVYPTRKAWLVTLTYAEHQGWSPEDVSGALRLMRKWCDRQGVRMVFAWSMELTKRGRPHYHIVLWLPRHLECPKWDTRGWWTKGMSNRKLAKFAPGYIAKYISKGLRDVAENGHGERGWDAENQVAYGLPRKARMHGQGGLKGADLDELRWWLMPRWMRETVKWMGTARRTIGGWICKQTGEIFPTPWEVSFSNGRAWFRKKSPQSLKLPDRTPTNAVPNWSNCATC